MQTDVIMNDVTVDSVVCVYVCSSVVASDVEGTLLAPAVEVSSNVVIGVVVDSVLIVDVSMGRIISITNISVSLFKPNSVKCMGTAPGIPSIWMSLGAAFQGEKT